MHVGFVTPEYVTERNFDGGLANYLHRTAIALSQRGHDVEVFVTSGSGRKETFQHRGVAVHRVRLANPDWAALWRRLPGKFRLPLVRHNLVQAWNLAGAVICRHLQAPFDVVQSTNVSNVGSFLMLHHPFPVVTRISSYAPHWREAAKWPTTLDGSILEKLESLSIRKSEIAYAPSRLLAQLWKEKEGVPCEVCEPPFFVETSVEQRGDISVQGLPFRYILFVGTMGRLKGVDLLAEAMPGIFDLHRDVELVLVGKDAGYRGSTMLQYVFDRAGPYSGRVRYLGVLRHHDLYTVIARATVVALPSRIDNLPNTCLESMGLGRVVVASTNASFEELIEPEKSGLLFENGNVRSLVNTLNLALDLPEQARRQIGAAAQRRVERFAPEYTIPKLEEIFKRAVALFRG